MSKTWWFSIISLLVIIFILGFWYIGSHYDDVYLTIVHKGEFLLLPTRTEIGIWTSNRIARAYRWAVDYNLKKDYKLSFGDSSNLGQRDLLTLVRSRFYSLAGKDLPSELVISPVKSYFGSFSGGYLPGDTIFYDSTKTIDEQFSTIGHELGHMISEQCDLILWEAAAITWEWIWVSSSYQDSQALMTAMGASRFSAPGNSDYYHRTANLLVLDLWEQQETLIELFYLLDKGDWRQLEMVTKLCFWCKIRV